MNDKISDKDKSDWENFLKSKEKLIDKDHKQKTNQGFTFKYNVTKLVYFEKFPDIYQAINREKQIKKWSRKAKDRLIQTMNPTWKDLF